MRRLRIVVQSCRCEPDGGCDVLDHVRVRGTKRSVVITPFPRDTQVPSATRIRAAVGNERLTSRNDVEQYRSTILDQLSCSALREPGHAFTRRMARVLVAGR